MFLFKRTKNKPNTEISLPESDQAAEAIDPELDKLGKELEISILYKKRDNAMQEVNTATLYRNLVKQMMELTCDFDCRIFPTTSDTFSLHLNPIPHTDPGFKGKAEYIGFKDTSIHLSKRTKDIEVSFYMKDSTTNSIKFSYKYNSFNIGEEIRSKIYNYLLTVADGNIGGSVKLIYDKDEAFIKYLFYIIETAINNYLKEITTTLNDLNKELETQVVNM